MWINAKYCDKMYKYINVLEVERREVQNIICLKEVCLPFITFEEIGFY